MFCNKRLLFRFFHSLRIQPSGFLQEQVFFHSHSYCCSNSSCVLRCNFHGWKCVPVLVCADLHLALYFHHLWHWISRFQFCSFTELKQYFALIWSALRNHTSLGFASCRSRSNHNSAATCGLDSAIACCPTRNRCLTSRMEPFQYIQYPCDLRHWSSSCRHQQHPCIPLCTPPICNPPCPRGTWKRFWFEQRRCPRPPPLAY
mmetsp:Transcript_37674/g.74135  ORF Transcript_37674/g.74135 Transcript_37674/m.74135 type:complete len:202 (-) Transcript_37674:593-1198(-)